MFKKILIANRGEIALRIMRTAKEMGMDTAVVYSEQDRLAPHTLLSDTAIAIGGNTSEESYLNIDKILWAAKKLKVDAVHPGYGFLSEISSFAKRLKEEGIAFIGPSPEAMDKAGNKVEAKKLAEKVGVPIVEGKEVDPFNEDECLNSARSVGFPLLLKATFGGGGKGMRYIEKEEELLSMLSSAREEARTSLGNPALYIEKYITSPRHIEIQILSDKKGKVATFYERDCTLQRRHQKLLEETPSPVVDDKLRKNLMEAAYYIVKEIDYTNAGTVEFLLDSDKRFYFLEINARLQVEHPITEAIYNLDIVREQFRIASGDAIDFKEKIEPRGCAMESRIYAEDPLNNFVPSGGRVTFLKEPTGPMIRVDSGIYQGYDIPLFYDPLLAKLIVWGYTRDICISRMDSALSQYILEGVITNIEFLRFVLNHKDFKEGIIDTNFVVKNPYTPQEDIMPPSLAVSVWEKTRSSDRKPDAKPVVESMWKLLGRRMMMRGDPVELP